MAQVFITASCHADIVVLALDDVQYMDKLSWKVVHSIMGMGERILLVCGSRPLDTCRLALDEDFWEALKRRSKKRFNEVYLKSLEKREIRQLAALCLKCDVDDLDDRFINDVYMHSGGMPYFASMILKNCHRNNLFKRFENNKIGWRPQRRNVSFHASAFYYVHFFLPFQSEPIVSYFIAPLESGRLTLC